MFGAALTTFPDFEYDNHFSSISAPELLLSSTTPGDNEAAGLQDTIRTAHSLLLPMDLAIAIGDGGQDEVMVSTWAAKRQRLVDFIDVQKAVLSTIRRIPFEVMALVFEFVAQDPAVSGVGLQLASHTEGLRLVNGPWMLGQVCKVWRDVALQTSALWTNATIFTDPTKKHAPECTCGVIRKRKFAALAEGVRRAGHRSMSLRLGCNGPADDKQLFDILFHNLASRWGSVSLTLHRRDVAAIYPRGALSSLRSLDLDCPPDVLPKVLGLFAISGGQHSPTTVAVTSNQRSESGLSWGPLPLPLANLTKLSIGGRQDIQHILSLLQMTPMVEIVDTGRWTLSATPKGPPITLPRLQQLVTQQPHILDCLILPALHTLCIEDSTSLPTDSQWVKGISHLVARSDCHIRTLRSDGPESILSVLKELPSLVTVTLRRKWYCHESIRLNLEYRELVQDLKDPDFLPLLEHLEISGIGADRPGHTTLDDHTHRLPLTFIDQSFVEMLEIKQGRGGDGFSLSITVDPGMECPVPLLTNHACLRRTLEVIGDGLLLELPISLDDLIEQFHRVTSRV